MTVDSSASASVQADGMSSPNGASSSVQDPDCDESDTSFTSMRIGRGAGADETDNIGMVELFTADQWDTNNLLQDCSTDGESLDSGQ